MSTPLHNEMAAALAELREQQSRITEAVERLKSADATVVSEDRLISASVNGQGRITELKFAGRRWRELAPKELAARIVDVVTKAQDKAAESTNALVSGLMPEGVDLDRLRDAGPDLDALFGAAVADAGRWTR